MTLEFDDTYLAGFEKILSAITRGDLASARGDVERLSSTPVQSSRRTEVSLKRWAAIFARDHYTCRYCLRKTIARPVLRAVSRAFPDVFRYHPNWKASATDAAYLVLGTSGDHILPVTRGGTSEPSNLLTTCWTCNALKSNLLLSELAGIRIQNVAPTSWRGLTEYLPALMAALGLSSDSHFRLWLAAIEHPEPLHGVPLPE